MNSVASPENTHSFWYHGAIFLGKLPLPEYQSNLEELSPGDRHLDADVYHR